ncbi:MAG: hypothetical protein ACOX7R_02065 [Acetivibrionales bacterium]|jgi:hypothetical protein
MKDNVIRVTSSEKELITKLRGINVFEFKDIIAELQKLILISKVTGEKNEFKYVDFIFDLLKDLMQEKENLTIKKLNKNKSKSQVRNKANTIEPESISTEQKPRIAEPDEPSEKQLQSGNDTKKEELKQEPAQPNIDELNPPVLLEKLKARNFKSILSQRFNKDES